MAQNEQQKGQQTSQRGTRTGGTQGPGAQQDPKQQEQGDGGEMPQRRSTQGPGRRPEPESQPSSAHRTPDQHGGDEDDESEQGGQAPGAGRNA